MNNRISVINRKFNVSKVGIKRSRKYRLVPILILPQDKDNQEKFDINEYNLEEDFIDNSDLVEQNVSVVNGPFSSVVQSDVSSSSHVVSGKEEKSKDEGEEGENEKKYPAISSFSLPDFVPSFFTFPLSNFYNDENDIEMLDDECMLNNNNLTTAAGLNIHESDNDDNDNDI